VLEALQALKDAEGEPRSEAPESVPCRGLAGRHHGLRTRARRRRPAPSSKRAPAATRAPLPCRRPARCRSRCWRRSQPCCRSKAAPEVGRQRRGRPRRRRRDRPRPVPDLRGRGGRTDARSWAALLRSVGRHPTQREPRDQVLRALHTLKGSARLAGALQLGELAHRMESEVEYLGPTTSRPPTSRRCCTASTRCRRASTRCAPPAASPRRRRPVEAPAPRSPCRSVPPNRRRPPRRARRPPPQAAPQDAAPQPAAPVARPAHRHRDAGAASGAPRARPPTRPCACARSCWTAGHAGRRGDDHPLAPGSRTEAAARLAGRPHRQPGPPAQPAARHRSAGRVADAVAHGAGQGHGPASTRWSSTASPACRN
jgi:hypothetical protein